jgi:uncharacterized protein YndB with AHSA1/START domain/predicted GNAT family acetyltransferase
LKLAYEIELSLPPEQVWPALTEPDLVKRWYFGLSLEGEPRPGATLTWRLPDGKLAEQAVVNELEPGRRLVLETRFMFTPEVSQDPTHLATWDVEPRGSGSLVRITREFPAENATSRAAGNDGDGVLLGLRVAIDPVAQAEIARLEAIGEVSIRDVTPERVGDYQRFFDEDAFRDYPAWRGCYCMEPLFAGTDHEWAMTTGAANREEVSRRLRERQTTAQLAYVDERPVGWCHYGPSTRLAQLMRRYHLQAEEQEKVGSIGCFVIAAPYRGHGIAGQLLDAACERLREAGMEWVEAYPRGDRDSAQGNFRGPLRLYRAAGFEPLREAGGTTIMRKRL